MKKSNILKFPKEIRKLIILVETEINEIAQALQVKKPNLKAIKKDAMENFKEFEKYLYSTCFSDYPNYINNEHKKSIEKMSTQESIIKLELIMQIITTRMAFHNHILENQSSN